MSFNFSDRRRMVTRHDAGHKHLSDADVSLGEVEVYVWREAKSAMVQWRHLKDDADPSNVPQDATWRVERSSSPYGPWQTVAEGLARTVRQIRDDDVPQSRTNSRYVFYRVSWESGDTVRSYGRAPQWDGEGLPVGGVTWDFGGVPSHKAPAVNREIRARLHMVHHHFTGEPCLIYRPGWMSPMDPAKVNPYTGILEGDYGEDSTSLGQPFLGGYDHPVVALISGVDGVPVTVKIAGGRISDMHEQVTGEMLYWPPVQIDDILRFYNGELLQVTGVSAAMHMGQSNNFLVNLSEIERDHPINDLPMPSGFRERALNPRRSAARPMNLEAYRKSMAGGTMGRMSMTPKTSPPSSGEDDR